MASPDQKTQPDSAAAEIPDAPKKGGGMMKLLSGVAVIVLTGLAVAWLSGWFETKIAPGSVEGARRGVPEGVETVVVASRSEPVIEWASGTVESAARTTVAARIVARIEQIHVAAGDAVDEGDVLFELDDRDLRARVQQAKDGFVAAGARLELANQELLRSDELLKKGVTTRQKHDQVVSDQRVAEAEVRQAEQVLKEAEAALSHSVIRASAPGRVIDRLAQPGDTVTPGVALVRLYDPRSLRVEAPVRESLAVDLKVGQRLAVDLASTGKTLEAPIEQIVPYAEPGARTLLVKVRLPEDSAAVAGMFARLAIPAGSRKRSIIPATAVRTIGQLKFVYVVEDGHIEQHVVTTGEHLSDQRVELLSGLEEGVTVASDWSKVSH